MVDAAASVFEQTDHELVLDAHDLDDLSPLTHLAARREVSPRSIPVVQTVRALHVPKEEVRLEQGC